MSVRVDLLPEEIGRRQKAARGRVAAAGGGVALLVVLAGVWFWQAQRVDDARMVLASEQETLDSLRADQAELSEFAALATRQESSMALLGAVLGGEASVAGVLQDLATVLPTDVQLESVMVSFDEQEMTIGDQRPALGSLTLTGFALNGHAPGLERVLLELDKLAAFSDVFFTDSTLEVFETGPVSEIARFSLQVDLGAELLTQRYAGGLPEELR